MLVNDSNVRKNTEYLNIITMLYDFFGTQSPFGPDNQNLIDMLRAPAIAVPYSLKGQLDYIKERWGMILGKYIFRLMSSYDLIQEEEKMRGFGSPQNEIYTYSSQDIEYEKFSVDKEWMPNLVLMAKCTLVWLDQLSKRYKKDITRLDQIPDEEIDELASYGFTGLWLIGIWERSSASKTIKHSCGNPDAESSAYSLYDYTIANELGGFDALNVLKEKCWRRGIRLASDMVPNHTGIDSKWVHEHPDWFVQLNYPPFPSYSFNSQNLSTNSHTGIYIEDHYYSKTDASVVFKRVDFNSGDTRYIYHGNDGTHMPWNDTAQLNFLNPETREAVIQTICHVARMFPIIRFDAAMTLAKKHFQRLWFPMPGSGGDIPSRAEYGMSKYDLDKVFPNEFWREVVDRIAAEVPDTLLLAEAFWLMEGYFVRTLGMHRVYNSAFMNMLKMEENQKYRYTIKNTMEFDPKILKRFVNFMNNPDEETAVAQFGKGDKYFGVCILMVTMPGLPMFGHAQIEGFTEKYGMEYRKAYWNEMPDNELIERHKREIFPLMKRRYLFADVSNFLLYDLYTHQGWVNENVFAYTNKYNSEKALVLYNNKFENVSGWIHTSSAYAERVGNSEEKRLIQKCLGDGLSLNNNSNYFCIFKDYITGLEYIRNCKEIWDKGVYVELYAFQYHVFLDFKEVLDNEYNHYNQLYVNLNGSGVRCIEEKLKEIILKPIYEKLHIVFNKENYETLFDLKDSINTKSKQFFTVMKEKFSSLLASIKNYYSMNGDIEKIAINVMDKLNVIIGFDSITKDSSDLMDYIRLGLNVNRKQIFYTLYSWLFLHQIGNIADEDKGVVYSRSWIDEWMLGRKIEFLFNELGINDMNSWEVIELIKILTIYNNWIYNEEVDTAYNFLNHLIRDQEVNQFLQINRYQDILWFNKERLEKLTWWLCTIGVINASLDSNKKTIQKVYNRIFKLIKTILEAAKGSDFQVEKLLLLLKTNDKDVK